MGAETNNLRRRATADEALTENGPTRRTAANAGAGSGPRFRRLSVFCHREQAGCRCPFQVEGRRRSSGASLELTGAILAKLFVLAVFFS